MLSYYFSQASLKLLAQVILFFCLSSLRSVMLSHGHLSALLTEFINCSLRVRKYNSLADGFINYTFNKYLLGVSYINFLPTKIYLQLKQQIVKNI